MNPSIYWEGIILVMAVPGVKVVIVCVINKERCVAPSLLSCACVGTTAAPAATAIYLRPAGLADLDLETK